MTSPKKADPNRIGIPDSQNELELLIEMCT